MANLTFRDNYTLVYKVGDKTISKEFKKLKWAYMAAIRAMRTGVIELTLTKTTPGYMPVVILTN